MKDDRETNGGEGSSGKEKELKTGTNKTNSDECERERGSERVEQRDATNDANNNKQREKIEL